MRNARSTRCGSSGVPARRARPVGRLADDAREIASPVVVVEVSSPSTAYRDVSAKLHGYFSLAGVHHYLIVAPERRRVIHHARGVGDGITTRILAKGPLALSPPGLTIQVETLFAVE